MYEIDPIQRVRSLKDILLKSVWHFVQDVDTVYNRPQQHSDFVDNAELYKSSTARRVIEKGESMVLDRKSIAQAHHYVLLHSEIISDHRG